ncbi:hypothetical protein GCM10027076_15420 [Nocardioides montaniterrae]
MEELVEAGIITGTADKDYDLIRFVATCLRSAARLEGYIEDARRSGDAQAADLFARAQSGAVRGAEEAKALLACRLTRKEMDADGYRSRSGAGPGGADPGAGRRQLRHPARG